MGGTALNLIDSAYEIVDFQSQIEKHLNNLSISNIFKNFVNICLINSNNIALLIIIANAAILSKNCIISFKENKITTTNLVNLKNSSNIVSLCLATSYYFAKHSKSCQKFILVGAAASLLLPYTILLAKHVYAKNSQSKKIKNVKYIEIESPNITIEHFNIINGKEIKADLKVVILSPTQTDSIILMFKKGTDASLATFSVKHNCLRMSHPIKQIKCYIKYGYREIEKSLKVNEYENKDSNKILFSTLDILNNLIKEFEKKIISHESELLLLKIKLIKLEKDLNNEKFASKVHKNTATHIEEAFINVINTIVKTLPNDNNMKNTAINNISQIIQSSGFFKHIQINRDNGTVAIRK